MKIAYLTAGAAGMFCGSCLHDNALAKAMLRLGHECILVPVYTPIRTDNEDVSIDKVFMGGINVYLQQKLPWLSYLPNWLDGFLNQPWLITPLTKNAGKTSPSLLGALSISMLKGTEGRQRKEFRRLLDWLDRDIQPDVLIFTNLLIGGAIPDVKKHSHAKVFVTLQGDDIFLDSLPTKYREKAVELMQKLVPLVDGFLIHSNDYADRMRSMLKIPTNKIHVVPLGIDLADLGNTPQVDRDPNSFSLGYLARMAPEKGLHRLVDAFIAIAHQPSAKHVKLKMAGWMGPQHAAFWAEQESKLTKAGLNDRWEYVGSIDRKDKAKFLSSIDLFCVPTTYAEPKGLFLLEAIASGVPYVQPDHGAFPELHQRLLKVSDKHLMGRLFRADSMDDLCAKLLDSIPANGRTSTVDPSILEEIGIAKHAQRVLDVLAKNT
ncbi:MAG: glycosyltransferase family 4 protein [Planctomycetota bacterium]|nr:glycosyltransferase family 4 protein [Planctomycetota bacterium]